MKEIDLKSILILLLAKIRWIIAGTVILALLFGGYAHFFVDEQYTCTAKVYVRNTTKEYNDSSNGTTAGNLTAAQQLVANYSIHMKTKPVLDEAVKKLGGKVTAAQLSAASSAAGVDATSWLRISVTLGDAKLAQEACEALAFASAESFDELDQSTAMVREVSKAAQTAPNTMKTVILGALLGMVLAVAIILIRQFTDDTIRDKHDLVAHIDVPVLGEIPSFELAKASKRKGGQSHA